MNTIKLTDYSAKTWSLRYPPHCQPLGPFLIILLLLWMTCIFVGGW